MHELFQPVRTLYPDQSQEQGAKHFSLSFLALPKTD